MDEKIQPQVEPKIEPIKEEHHEAVAALIDDFQKELVAMDSDHRLQWRPGFGEEYLKDNLKDVKEKGGQFLIAVVDEKPVGFIIGTPAKPYPHHQLSARIEELFVDPNFRGRGIATRLMDEMENFLRSKGVKEVWISVLLFNPTALELYKKRGYKGRDVSLLGYI